MKDRQQDVANNKRQPRLPEMVAARIHHELGKMKLRPVAEGVHPLNPGFFLLEEMRKQNTAKAKAAIKPAIRGK